MWRSPHKKRYPNREYAPEVGKHGSVGGHSGDTPPGKKKRMARFKTQQPGYPQGVHVPKDSKVVCYCGGCFEKNRGDINLIHG